jgi:phage terminase small subunit
MTHKDGLTEKQRRFVECFMGRCKGNATEAAKAAGVPKKSARVMGSRWLTKVAVQKAIASRVKSDPKVLDREELQQFWSAVTLAREEFQSTGMTDRLRASELLGKTQKLFSERVDVHHFDHEGHLAAIEERRRAGVPIAGGKKKP